ncbi:MAG TPA: squalene/phytoene synthase family protein, partial [Vicinamibacterales bacterium]|nr:squalene/phytoene synthase family protein [Vicinamibacterales bacterium]
MSRDTSFYYSFLVLPPRKRTAIIAVWDFCRAVDDAVDEVVPENEWAGGLSDEARAKATAQVAIWRAEVAATYDGTPQTPQGVGLQPFVSEFNLPRKSFEDLVDGVEMDLHNVRYETFTALAEYCRRVASAVGLICLEIFGYRNQSAKAYAENLGL